MRLLSDHITSDIFLPQLAMLGGNQRARQFFKQHGWYELGADKIEAKYTSRAAVLYKVCRQQEGAVCLCLVWSREQCMLDQDA
jgi:hypothetical protein